ncbi:hypothetical protein GCM10007932_05790 [Vibrio penaeicida]|uniref:Uncharacterized protein n=1 Tax=Vibrio penaeicida TaxID=104609 RepID=A0AAV5NLS9_9VIBR|nr:hypothetical protein GCM10007932_05790 [Vibrio penaeicida]
MSVNAKILFKFHTLVQVFTINGTDRHGMRYDPSVHFDQETIAGKDVLYELSAIN